MKLSKIIKFKRKVFIPGFTPKNLRNLIYKCSNSPESRFEDGTLQCPAGRFRSFGDIWNLANSYYPGTTEEEVAYHLARLCFKGYTFCNYCTTINRPVFYKGSIYDGKYGGNIRGKSSVAKALREIQAEKGAEWKAEPKKKVQQVLDENF